MVQVLNPELQAVQEHPVQVAVVLHLVPQVYLVYQVLHVVQALQVALVLQVQTVVQLNLSVLVLQVLQVQLVVLV